MGFLFFDIYHTDMSQLSYYTKEGLQKLKDELDHLKRVERPDISRQIGEARDKGDLSENAEYDAAKDRQAFVEGRICDLEYRNSLPS